MKNICQTFFPFELSLDAIAMSFKRRNFKWINQLIYIKSDFAVCLQLDDKLDEEGGTQRGW